MVAFIFFKWSISDAFTTLEQTYSKKSLSPEVFNPGFSVSPWAESSVTNRFNTFAAFLPLWAAAALLILLVSGEPSLSDEVSRVLSESYGSRLLLQAPPGLLLPRPRPWRAGFLSLLPWPLARPRPRPRPRPCARFLGNQKLNHWLGKFQQDSQLLFTCPEGLVG